LAVHGKDERARGCYEHFGFRSSPTDPLHLPVLLKDLQGITNSEWVGGDKQDVAGSNPAAGHFKAVAAVGRPGLRRW
jgi:hypothetical protein